MELVTHLALNGCLGEYVGVETGMGEGKGGDRRGGAGEQPVLDGAPLIGVPICRYDWIYHSDLHLAKVDALDTQHSVKTTLRRHVIDRKEMTSTVHVVAVEVKRYQVTATGHAEPHPMAEQHLVAG